jgi:hypothetical protein
VLVSLLLAAATASAQESADPADSARFQWGPVRFTPGIALTNVGVDNNVFNTTDDPLRDTTAAIGPAINLWTRVGQLRISDKSSGQYLYFKKFDNQRSWNTANEVKLELPLTRIKPFAIGSYVNTKDRPGFEIDSRARATTSIVTIGSDVRLSGKTTVVLSAGRTTTVFDQGETFLGTDLGAALNRYSDAEQLQFRYAVTPLTTFTVNTQAVQDRFHNDRLRNADSYAVVPGFEFKPFALIAGKVSAGFRHFNVLNERVQDYQGVVASVDAKYRLTTSTQVGARVARDLAFSYEERFPYYTLTESTLTITQRVASSWDVRATGDLLSLGYRGVDQAAADARTDRGQGLGLGVGYLVGETLRVGIDVNYYNRRSDVVSHSFNGLRAGASVTYGILQ